MKKYILLLLVTSIFAKSPFSNLNFLQIAIIGIYIVAMKYLSVYIMSLLSKAFPVLAVKENETLKWYQTLVLVAVFLTTYIGMIFVIASILMIFGIN